MTDTRSGAVILTTASGTKGINIPYQSPNLFRAVYRSATGTVSNPAIDDRSHQPAGIVAPGHQSVFHQTVGNYSAVKMTGQRPHIILAADLIGRLAAQPQVTDGSGGIAKKADKISSSPINRQITNRVA